MNKNSTAKIVAISLGALILLWLISTVLTGTGNGYGMYAGGNMMGYNHGGGQFMGNGAYYGGSFSYLLSMLIKILFAVMILGLVGGIIVWIKDYLFTAEDKAKLRQTFTGDRASTDFVTCSICGKELHSEWKVCPYCGKEKD